MEKPIPYDENSCEDRFWCVDPFDKNLPEQKGFITDLVYAGRGTEVPTMFTIWNAVIAISSAVKREAWLRWYPNNFYANFYVIFIAPPAVCKKSTSIGVTDKLLVDFHKEIKDKNLREMKRLRVERNKMTPEGMLEAMKPTSPFYHFTDAEGNYVKNDDGSFKKYERTSEVTLLLPELGVFLSRAKYNESMLQNLTDVYDTHDSWDYILKASKVELKRLFTNLVGATTPKSFRDGMPKMALGDGFLSRTIIVFQDWNPRRYPRPRPVPGAPEIKTMRKRLSWIATRAIGEYYMSKEADEYFYSWYDTFKDHLENVPTQAGVLGRKDGVFQKLALIMHLQRYAEDKEITLTDMKDAEKIMDATYARIPRALTLINDPEYWERILQIERYIKKKKKVDRKTLLRNQHLTAMQANEILGQLHQEGKIGIYDGREEVDTVFRHSMNTNYVWNGIKIEEWDDEDD